MWGVTALARLYPWPVATDPEFERAVGFLDLAVPAETLVRCGYALGMVGSLSMVVGVLLAPPELRVFVALVLGLFTLLGSYGVTAGVQLLATARRVRALGNAPALVGSAVLSMRLSPAPERAAAFAAEASVGPLGDSLATHVRRASGTGESALATFGEEWDDWFPALSRSLALVDAAGTQTDSAREQTLENALTVVLDGTRDQLRSFAGPIQRPVTALYAFGILLPTALVALLPAASAAGVGVTITTVVLVYDIVLPLCILAAGVWLLANRPVAFTPPRVTRAHPNVSDRRFLAGCAGVASGALAGGLASLLLPPWGPPVAALGIGTGVTLLTLFQPHVAVHERMDAVESGLTDGLSLVGRRVSNGQAVETAIASAGSDLSGAVATLFSETATRQRRLQTDVERAFTGEYGTLATRPSTRLHTAATLLALAATEGQPGGTAITTLADHVADLERVEQAARHELRAVCGTLQSTGSLFGPLVAGSTVALAGDVGGGGVLPGSGDPLPGLGLAIGWYVLVLATILPALATGLVEGLDRAHVGVRVGKALLSATTVYLLAFVLVSGLA